MGMSRRVKFRNKRQNRFGMFLVTTVVLMLLIIVSIKSVELKAKQADYQAREEQLLAEIAVEEQEAKDLEEYRKYTQTKAYVEEVAKEKFGLVREGEIVFQTK